MIRPSTLDDLPLIMAMLDHSRSIMRANGNTTQWNGYPTQATIRNDIASGISFVVTNPDGNAIGCFTLLDQPEPTYAYIEDGLWLDDTTPYRTIHRLACAPDTHGVARQVFCWSETQCASIRVDTHSDNHIMRHIIQQQGYTYCGIVYMTDGTPREAYQKMTYPMVRPELKAYVEQRILPQHLQFDDAHHPDHILRVMAQSMDLAQHYPQLNKEMVYTIAAFHDIGVCEGRELHHLVSGRIIRQNTDLLQWFSPDQIETMAQAAEDHRASATQSPRSLYGMIVAEADRDIEPLSILRRTVQYGLSYYPQLDKEGHWQRTLQHLEEKYSPNGYLKLFIPQSRNKSQMIALQALIADTARLKTFFDQIYSQETLSNPQ